MIMRQKQKHRETFVMKGLMGSICVTDLPRFRGRKRCRPLLREAISVSVSFLTDGLEPNTSRLVAATRHMAAICRYMWSETHRSVIVSFNHSRLVFTCSADGRKSFITKPTRITKHTQTNLSDYVN